MGLLDQLFGAGGDDPRSQANMALAAGLLSGNLAGGLLGANQVFAEAPDRKMRRDLMGMQIESARSEIEQRKAAMAKQQQLQDYLGGLFGAGGVSAAQVSHGAFSPSADGMGPTMPPQMVAQSRPGSRLANLSIDQVAGLHALGGPNLMDAYKWANDPLKLEQGSTYKDRVTGEERFMPKVEAGIAPDANGFYGPLNGYAEAAATIKGAEAGAQEAAKAANTLLPLGYVDKATGRPVGGTVGGYIQSQPLRNTGGGQLTPELQEAIRADAARSGITNPRVNLTAPGVSNPVFGVAGAAPSTQARPGEALQSTAETKSEEVFAESSAKDLAETRKSIVAAGFSAPSRIAKYQQLGQLLSDVDGGRLTATGTNIASAANSLGLKIDKNLPNKEAAAALGNEMALALRNPAGGAGMPGAMSDKDREFLVGMIPNAGQTLQGRKMLIDAQIALAKREQQVSQFLRNYEKKYGKIDNNFFDQMQEWSNANPLFKGQ